MYQILTEDTNRSKIEAVLLRHGLDFNLEETEGAYHGKMEKSLTISIDGYPLSEILPAAREIRKMNNQDCVYIEHIPTRLSALKEGVKCPISIPEFASTPSSEKSS